MSSDFLVESKITKQTVFESQSMMPEPEDSKPKVSYLNIDEKFHSQYSKENSETPQKISKFE